jgi:hypothetical protein
MTQLLVAATLIIMSASAFGQITPTNMFTSFYDDATTFNGNPVPIGSIIKAYDPDGILCGIDTVHTAGSYGFMPVYGDDLTTPGIDEGANADDTITFEINGQAATVDSGDPTFTNQANKQVQLSTAGPITIAITGIEMPTAKPGTFADTVRFEVGVRNDGSGLDFYGVTATNSKAFSKLDPTANVTGSVDLIFTITDVPDHGGALPDGFVLNQNYPNPFNPLTTVSFRLPTRTRARLEFIDLLGRTVDVVTLGALPAGDHSVNYNAEKLASGVYFYRLVTDIAVDTRKMLLLK